MAEIAASSSRMQCHANASSEFDTQRIIVVNANLSCEADIKSGYACASLSESTTERQRNTDVEKEASIPRSEIVGAVLPAGEDCEEN